MAPSASAPAPSLPAAGLQPARPRPAVRCRCGRTVFDGLVVKARVIRVEVGHCEAKCHCKRWVRLPLVYRESA